MDRLKKKIHTSKKPVLTILVIFNSEVKKDG